MSGHCPGSWMLANQKSAPFYVVTHSGEDIAQVDSCPADARLIAAAPELLAALKETTECLIAAEESDFNERASLVSQLFKPSERVIENFALIKRVEQG